MAACYWRNGTENTHPAYAPRINDTSNPLSTICCASWDNLLPNGLCQNKDSSTIYRETCTKSSWEGGGCQELCSAESPSQRDNDEIVTPCTGAADSATWCCGSSNQCCAERSTIPRYTIAARFGDPIPTATSSIVSSTMSSMISSSISTLPATSTAIATGNSGLSVGAKAGIGVGATLGAIALIGLGIFIAQALRWRKKARDATPSTRVPEEYMLKDIYRYEQGGNPAQLAGGESELHEMPGSVRVSELDQVPYSRPVGGLAAKA